ncbi:MAG: hypothetical protein GY710_26615 [Desulfobacteraceae bacterium]|nr:hypothetical protein [Desulfobacteraceae bacterium]
MSKLIHFAALLDAIQWLTYQQSLGLVKLIGKERKRVFSLDRSFTVHSLALVLDPADGQLFLAMRDDASQKWFTNLPWTKLQVYKQTPAFLNLICDNIVFPGFPEIQFEGGSLSVFSLKIPIYSKLIKILTKKEVINIGLFKTGETKKELVLTEKPLTKDIPVEIHEQR